MASMMCRLVHDEISEPIRHRHFREIKGDLEVFHLQIAYTTFLVSLILKVVRWWMATRLTTIDDCFYDRKWPA